MTSIHLDIAIQNLGNGSEEDNERYRAAVETAISRAYEGAEVSVSLFGDGNRDRAYVDGFEDEEQTQAAVRGIAQDVFNRGGW
jgi:hypothetical protein